MVFFCSFMTVPLLLGAVVLSLTFLVHKPRGSPGLKFKHASLRGTRRSCTKEASTKLSLVLLNNTL